MPVELNDGNMETLLNCLDIFPGNRTFRNVIQSRIQLNTLFPAHFGNRTAWVEISKGNVKFLKEIVDTARHLKFQGLFKIL